MPHVDLLDVYDENSDIHGGDGYIPFEIDDIRYDDDFDGEDLPTRIQFEYGGVTMDTTASARFTKHEIIGGSVVRQKVGEDPLEITINSVCTEAEARQVDELKKAESGVIYSNRLPGNSVRVHIASSSTSPLGDGRGAVDFTTGQFLYTYTLNLVQIQRTIDQDVADDGADSNLIDQATGGGGNVL